MARFDSSSPEDVTCLAICKVTKSGVNEKYVFMFTDANRQEFLRTLGRFAADPELSFTWYDAAVLSQKAGAQS